MAEKVNEFVRKVENKEEFEQCLQDAGDKLVVVDFYADWCGPCKMIGPKVEEMAKELKDTVVFLKVDVDSDGCADLAEEHEVQAMPTFKFFKNGKKVCDFVGANALKLREEVLKNMTQQVKS